ncbi:probable cinnamyl alcohol dehydrogenase 1 isoform X2 [Phalaenopsis equestris]|uniref:probable cinnamyl alcohol dehydrogenase 1 isoform X2 n=1 Tax=Phalaenopsis equestris TaxID=78828 RepID=UPI0009E39712|nr:probable cinnamyl alcohol dehydrogenase 1 isoform X2 [Phalaenopsis equestris]
MLRNKLTAMAFISVSSCSPIIFSKSKFLSMSSERENRDCFGWAARDASGFLSPYKFSRRALRDGDVSLRITHCGVCYADVVFCRNEVNNSIYPVVPGHEIVGVVTTISTGVTDFKIGDIVGVGAYINSCQTCKYCNSDKENKCAKGITFTFNGIDIDGSITKGGYSSYIVVNQRYCFKIPDGYPPELAAPLLCAGITVYAPIIHHHMNQSGKSLGVIGLGGLGHMAVKYGKAFGLKVVVFSTSLSKKDEALEILGADEFVLSSDEKQMQALSNSLDFIIDTTSGPHPFEPYMSILKTEGTLVLVGAPGEIRMPPGSLIFGSKSISGSAVGGTKDIKEMLEFSAANKIYPKIELIPITYINEALDRLVKRDIKYRFVIDIENSLK